MKDATKKSKPSKKKDTKEIVPLKQLNSELDAGAESQIVLLEPSQTYIFRDFLATNSTLNESMDILKQQNKSLVEKVQESKNADERAENLRAAAYEVRQNAHALASMVQAKVAYIKTIKK